MRRKDWLMGSRNKSKPPKVKNRRLAGGPAVKPWVYEFYMEKVKQLCETEGLPKNCLPTVLERFAQAGYDPSLNGIKEWKAFKEELTPEPTNGHHPNSHGWRHIAWTWIVSANGDIELVSPEAEQRTGLKVSGDNWAQLIYPDDLAESINAFVTGLEKQQAWEVIHRVRQANGKFRWMHSRGKLRPPEKGKFSGFFGQARYLSEEEIKTKGLPSAN
jgi:PAS domain S-box-containing protein